MVGARAAVLAVGALALWLTSAYAAADVPMALASFRAGRFDEASRLLETQAATPDGVRRLPDHLRRALDGVRPGVAAAFYLEAAVAVFDVDPEVGVALLFRGRSRAVAAGRAFELKWHHAMTAFLQGPTTEGRLVRPAPDGFVENDATIYRGNDFPKARTEYADTFLIEATRRFPDDVELGLAVWSSSAVAMHTYFHTTNVVLRSPTLPTPRRGSIKFHGIRSDGAIASVRRLVGKGDANQNAMAQIYLGYFHLIAGEHTEALEQWRVAAATATDPRLQYLALVWQARVRSTQPGGLEAALRGLHAAHQLFPRAQTARRLLAATLFIAGQRDEARRLNDAMLAEPPGDDPWWLLWRGRFDTWPTRRAELRALAR